MNVPPEQSQEPTLPTQVVRFEMPDYTAQMNQMLLQMGEIVEYCKRQSNEIYSMRMGIYCYTESEVAEMLKVTTVTLHKWEKNKKLLPVKIGGKKLYRHTDIDALLIAHIKWPDGTKNTDVEAMQKSFEQSLSRTQRRRMAEAAAFQAKNTR